MSALSKEVRHVQNPALGSVILWRFTVGFNEAHATSESPVLPLAFLVLPIVLHRETFDLLRSTNRPTGLLGFADKFARSEVGQADLLLALHTRAEAMRPLTVRALQTGVRCRLFTVSSKDAQVIPLSTTKASSIAASVRPIVDGAEKLGAWFSQLTLFEVSSALKVAF